MDMGTRSLSSFGGGFYYAVIVRGALAVKRGLVAAGYQELSLSMLRCGQEGVDHRG